MRSDGLCCLFQRTCLDRSTDNRSAYQEPQTRLVGLFFCSFLYGLRRTEASIFIQHGTVRNHGVKLLGPVRLV